MVIWGLVNVVLGTAAVARVLSGRGFLWHRALAHGDLREQLSVGRLEEFHVIRKGQQDCRGLVLPIPAPAPAPAPADGVVAERRGRVLGGVQSWGGLHEG